MVLERLDSGKIITQVTSTQENYEKFTLYKNYHMNRNMYDQGAIFQLPGIIHFNLRLFDLNYVPVLKQR